MALLRLLSLVFCLFLAGQNTNAIQVLQHPETLSAGTPIERELKGGETHTYQIQLTVGQFVRFRLEQRTINAALALTAPDGKQFERDLSGAGGEESLSLEITTTGAYRLTIKGTGAASRSGSYRLETTIKAAASEADKKHINAEALMVEANALARKGANTAPQRIEKLLTASHFWRELGEPYWAATALYRIADADLDRNEYKHAVDYYEQALRGYREAKNRTWEAWTLYFIGFAYGRMGQYQKTIEFHMQALAIHREMKNRAEEGAALGGLGVAYVFLGRFEKAVEYLEQALPIYREVNDRGGEALVINNLAAGYTYLGRNEKGLEYTEQALAISRETKNKTREAAALQGLGIINAALGRIDKAIEYYDQALRISREIKDRRVESYVLGGLADAYFLKGQLERAVETYNLCLAVIREIKNKGLEIEPLIGLGDVYRNLRRYQESDRAYQQALQLARELKTQNNEAWALGGLMLLWKARNRSQLAIYFGKQSINVYQDIRNNIREMDPDTQRSFLKSKEQTYRQLADLLIAGGRLPEAEQVIRMLKEDEYFEFIRRDESNSPKTDRAQLTPEEQKLQKRYHEVADRLTEIGTERSALIDKKGRTPEEEQRLAKLETDLVIAGEAFQKFLDGLTNEMGKNADTNARAFQLRESQGMMGDLRELGKGVVALYTLVGTDKYRVILTTPDFQKGYEYPIKAEELNRKVLAFREVLLNPRVDPLPLAQDLYQILLGPVARDLQGVKAEMLMWSLDGVLRYVPVAALHDGRQYLVERYRNAVFTPASQTRLKDLPGRQWSALGLGVTKAHGAGIPALPGVAEEMRGIIKDETAGTTSGVLPGVIKLDEQFTQEAMLAGLRQRPPVVHVASHFQFQPGNESNSALLLGDGSFLSLAQIKTLPNVFSGVELLTLSACNTATGGSGANGKEVEGFAVLAQRQGAKAVVASLWPVFDTSTKILMQEFYRLRETKSGTTKIEALRQAQLELLHGTHSSVVASSSNDRQIVHEEAKPGELSKPLFKPDPKAPYAHPYYWAPFTLIGNWR